MNNIITCSHASFGYEGRAVVRDLSFSVNCGDYLCIVGENGSGKSTLIRGLLRLLPPLSGTVSFAPGLRHGVTGYLSQTEAVRKDFPAGVDEIVLSAFVSRMGLRPFYTKHEKEAALANLQRLDILDLRNRCFRELSGGQQRRVLIARALCAAEDLLVLDEPASGLDPLAAAELYALLARINRENGVSLIVVTHDINSGLSHASHVLHLAAGDWFFGTKEVYEKSAFLEKITVRSPADEAGIPVYTDNGGPK